MYYSIQSRYDNIRDLPYPYKGMLAISNDAEYLSFDFLEEFYKFLNTKQETKLGLGLGLECATSMFFFSDKKYNFSYFDGLDANSKKTNYSNRINEYIKAGVIDTNHSYGDFDFVGGFERKHALRTYEELNKNNLSLKIYTNHGTEDNTQNIGGDAHYHSGDIIGSTVYHSDLLSQNDVTYLWSDTCTDEFEPKVGLGFNIKRNPKNRGYKLLEEKTLQDNNNILTFNRLRNTGLNAPNFSSLNYQISSIDWNDFYNNSSIVVLYQHLGAFNRTHEVNQTTIELIKKYEYYLSGLRFLSQEQQVGNLKVTTTIKLLNYTNMINTTKVDIDEENSKIILNNYNNIKDPSDFFQGLTIYVNPRINFDVFYKDTKLNIEHNGPDNTGQYSISIENKTMADIW